MTNNEIHGHADPQAGAGRYFRQMDMVGVEGQAKLRNATVLVAGVGGLGGTAALYLAAAGIGKLILVHEGVTVLPDLNRQILMSTDGIGRTRVDQATESLSKLNPDVEIEVWNGKVEPEAVRPLVRKADLVIDARYDFPERYELNRLCLAEGKPMIEAAMYGYEISMTTVVPGETPCLECLYPESPKVWEPLGFPVLGAVSGMAGCMASLEAIKWLLGKPGLAGKLMRFDSLTFQSVEIDVAQAPRCELCGSL
ncbi:HesA/MoeB/ThiF family protein [Gorillibacterium timonense]|uniref:HesA/MoeB/ThiF family protein n=1 Tax=Gorillibacterium timonense TaxID=1689269 RepID=UPI00071CDAC2|nr:HesA/MoeB/ThiF family protein [Gorillibacterium timonense]